MMYDKLKKKLKRLCGSLSFSKNFHFDMRNYLA